MTQKLCRTLSRPLRLWELNITADLRNWCECMDTLTIAQVKCHDGYFCIQQWTFRFYKIWRLHELAKWILGVKCWTKRRHCSPVFLKTVTYFSGLIRTPPLSLVSIRVTTSLSGSDAKQSPPYPQKVRTSCTQKIRPFMSHDFHCA